MPNSQQPLHEVVRALLSLRPSLQVHGAAWWALERELYAKYGRQAVDVEFLRQRDVAHGYAEDIKRPVNEAALKDGFLRAIIWVQDRMLKNHGLPYADQIFGIKALLHLATAGSQMVEDALIEAQHIRADKAEQKRKAKPTPPKGRVQKESEPPQEAGAQMCRACNGAGEVQGEIQGGPPGPMVCNACNGEGTVTQ